MNPFDHEPIQAISKQEVKDVKVAEKENQLNDSKTHQFENMTQKLLAKVHKHTIEEITPSKKEHSKKDVQESASVDDDKPEILFAKKGSKAKLPTKSKFDKKSTKQTYVEPAVPSTLPLQPDIQVSEYQAELTSEVQFSTPFTDSQVGLQYPPGIFQPYIGPEGEVSSFIASGQQLISSGLGTYTTPQTYCEQPLFVGDTFGVDSGIYHIQQSADYQPHVFVSDPQSYITSFGGSHTAYTHVETTPSVHGTDNETIVSYASILAQGLSSGPQMNLSRLQMQTEVQPWSSSPICDASIVIDNAENYKHVDNEDKVSTKGMKQSKSPLIRNETSVSELESPFVRMQADITVKDLQQQGICQKDFNEEDLDQSICKASDASVFDDLQHNKKNKQKEKHSLGTKSQNVNSTIKKSLDEPMPKSDGSVQKQTKKNEAKEIKSLVTKPILLIKEKVSEKEQALSSSQLKAINKSSTPRIGVVTDINNNRPCKMPLKFSRKMPLKFSQLSIFQRKHHCPVNIVPIKI